MQESLGRGFSRFLRNPRFGSALRLLLYHAERKGRKGSSIRESLSEITPTDRKIRHDPWPKWAATLRACIPRSISKRRRHKEGQRQRERTPRGGTLTLDNPPLHGPPLRNCVRARYQLAESNLVFRGLGRLAHRKRVAAL